ncbi:hypothetical protein M9Y10_012723 [Tritrichomonas musculus]|uniref:Uncharacterized protein n=1 Tax=Tritrichomonas musculus TaxID=1915356 RepID=A0ABR2IDF1_9EUKA
MPIPHKVTKDFFLANSEVHHTRPDVDDPSHDINILTMLFGLLFNTSRNRDITNGNRIVSYSIIEVSSNAQQNHSTVLIVENRVSRHRSPRDSVEESEHYSPTRLTINGDRNDEISDFIF